MLEVVFSDSAAGTMAVAIGHKGFLGGATLYDTFILRELDTLDDEFKESVLVGQVLGKNQLGIGDGWIALRVEQFIKEGLLVPITTPAPNAPIYHRMLKKIK